MSGARLELTLVTSDLLAWTDTRALGDRFGIAEPQRPRHGETEVPARLEVLGTLLPSEVERATLLDGADGR